MRKTVILSAILLASQFITGELKANDGVYYTSGNTLIPLVETDLQVQKEILTISIGDNPDAAVDVYYEFLNPTNQPKSVRMGFEAAPSYAAACEEPGINSAHPFIYDFKVEFNGAELKFQNALAWDKSLDFITKKDLETWKMDGWESSMFSEQYPDSARSFAYVYYFDVTFKPGVNRVHHTYRYKMSETIGTTFEVPYRLTPASRWAGGCIGDFTLNINVPKTAKHFFADCSSLVGIEPKVTDGMGKFRRGLAPESDQEISSMEISLRNGTLTWHAINFVPDNDLYIFSADVHTTFNPEAQLGAFYDRTNTRQLNSPYIDENEVRDELPEDFRKAVTRNLPYAHRGRIFKRKDLDKYFRSLWWYMPDPNYTDDSSDFTDADWYYVRHGK